MVSTSARLVFGQSTGYLVQQQHARARVASARAAPGAWDQQRKRTRKLIGAPRQCRARQDIHAQPARFRFAHPATEDRGHQQVLEYRHARERVRNLVRAADAARQRRCGASR
jgi:hypothetical protein